MMPNKATAADFLNLFAGQTDLISRGPATSNIWRDRAEEIAAFLAAHEDRLPDAASFTMLLQIGGLLMLMAERSDTGGAA